jgi:hypothetical protein
MRFYLNFKSDSYGKKRIDEPFGVDGIKFSLKQNGRQVQWLEIFPLVVEKYN